MAPEHKLIIAAMMMLGGVALLVNAYLTRKPPPTPRAPVVAEYTPQAPREVWRIEVQSYREFAAEHPGLTGMMIFSHKTEKIRAEAPFAVEDGRLYVTDETGAFIEAVKRAPSGTHFWNASYTEGGIQMGHVKMIEQTSGAKFRTYVASAPSAGAVR